MSSRPLVGVISRIALDAAAALDLTTGAISLAVMTVGIVAPGLYKPVRGGLSRAVNLTCQRRII